MRAASRGGLVRILVAVVAAMAMAVACEDESPPQDEGVWVAFVPPAPDIRDIGYVTPIHVMNVVTGERRELGEPARYLAPLWSPDGTLLAALRVHTDAQEGEPASEVVILPRDGGEARVVALEDRLHSSPLAWSPYSTRLALDGQGALVMVDREGEVVGETPAIPSASGSTSSVDARNPWSPDSRHFAAIASRALLLADRDGNGRNVELLPIAYEDEAWGLYMLEWRSDDEIAFVRVGTPTPEEYIATIGDELTWSNPEPFDAAMLTPLEVRRAEVNHLHPERQAIDLRRSADGSAEVFTLAQPVEGPGGPRHTREASLAIRGDGWETLVDLGSAVQRPPLVGGFDAVVVLGWEGEVPAEASMAVEHPPQPSPAPRNTQAPAPPPPPAKANPTPVPFPAPRGERVQAKVADVPAFPGAVEIDGWVQDVNGFEAAVQMFETDEPPAEVIAYFTAGLEAAGWRRDGGSHGVTGESWDYARGLDRVSISTEYRLRPDVPPMDPPPGFRGKGVPYLPGADGKTWFFVTTLRGE